MTLLQAGVSAVASDKLSGGSGQSTPTASAGPTSMDSDQAIVSSTLGKSGKTDSDSQPKDSAASVSVVPEQSAEAPAAAETASDFVMVEAAAAAEGLTDPGTDAMDESGVPGPSGANESPVQDASCAERDIAQMGYAVQFIVQGLRNGAGPTLMPMLVQLLPFLLKTQVHFCFDTTAAFVPIELSIIQRNCCIQNAVTRLLHTARKSIC